MPLRRRALLWLGPAAWLGPVAAASESTGASVSELLRRGGVVLALRHARAPGTFDPPDFRLGDCRTQRNLDESGRAQAKRLGAWFAAQGLKPAAVRSSPWCRCVDTAQLAFGRAEVWPALGSPRGGDAPRNAQHLAQLRAALREVGGRPGVFEVWVTHMFVLSALTGHGSESGEGLVLQHDESMPRLLARLTPP